MNSKIALIKTFSIPLVILLGIFIYLILNFLLNLPKIAEIAAVLATILGAYRLFIESFQNMLKKQFALDYIAILAIVVSLFTKEYLVAAIIALMLSSGRTLEDYGVAQAKKSLTKLIERIPNEVFLWKNGKIGEKIKLDKIKIGDEIFVRKGEVIGLDGILASKDGLTDESSLTGEPYTIEKIEGDAIRSGTINIGNPIAIRVTKTQENSTYKKIVDMVRAAQEEKSSMIRMADRYSGIFTLVTVVISVFAYVYSNFDLTRALAVLVIATPCPLIIATPIALLGGVNSASKKQIIVKKLASLEVLSKAKTLIFDKTGTITLGRPKVIEFETREDRKKILAISEAIERNSLHPLAKAIVSYARENKAPIVHAQKVEEKIGIGITGQVGKEKYTISKLPSKGGMAIGVFNKGENIALFRFEDEIKEESKNIIRHLKEKGFELFIFTGDKKESAEKVVKDLGEEVVIKAEASPEDKQKGIRDLKNQGKITAMVGDGINDAPALAFADVGMVFSNEEQTAASEAADIVFLGGDFSKVLDSMNIAKRTIDIALQSILWGIGLSITGMVLASFGFIPPIGGAFIQEGIDVAVILNALRASR